MEEPVLYDYTGNRPEDVDENTWKRKQESTKLIELETGVPLNELENLEDFLELAYRENDTLSVKDFEKKINFQKTFHHNYKI